jgi:hypothetical protein
MGKRFDALKDEIRDAVLWAARRNMEEFGNRYPNLASAALSPSTIKAVAEEIAKSAKLEDIVARYKAVFDAAAENG